MLRHVWDLRKNEILVRHEAAAPRKVWQASNTIYKPAAKKNEDIEFWFTLDLQPRHHPGLLWAPILVFGHGVPDECPCSARRVSLPCPLRQRP